MLHKLTVFRGINPSPASLGVILSVFISTFFIFLFGFATAFFGEQKTYTDADVIAFLNQTKSENESLPAVIEERATKKTQDQPREKAPRETAREEKVAQQAMTGKVIRIANENLTLQTTVKKSSSVEYLFPLGSEIRLKSLKSISELKRGDIVQIKFEQHYRETIEQEKIISKTVVTSIEKLPTVPTKDIYRSMEDSYEQKWGDK